jgi:uncharacterized protein YkwD
MVVRALLTVATLAAALASSSVAAAPARTPAASLSSLETSVLTQINHFRAAHHLARLRLSAPLTRAARSHSEEMAVDGIFQHESADGSPFWRRVRQFYRADAFGYWSAGENLLWSTPDVDARRALSMWLASPEHRRNLTDPRWREIGVSAVHETGAPGIYDGREVTILTTDFGVRR